jgi:hypothetical protein
MNATICLLIRRDGSIKFETVREGEFHLREAVSINSSPCRLDESILPTSPRISTRDYYQRAVIGPYRVFEEQ